MRKIALLATSAIATAAFPRAFENASGAGAATKPRVEPELTAAFAGIELPVVASNRGSKSIYPFDTLTAVGMAFGVKNKTKTQLASIVTNANKKAMVKKTDDSGAVVFKTQELKAADGTTTVVPTQEPEMVATAHYIAVDVDEAMKAKIKGTPLAGSTALIFRDK